LAPKRQVNRPTSQLIRWGDFSKRMGPIRLDRTTRWATAIASTGSGGPFLLGERYSLADIYLTVLITWHPDPAALLARHPALAGCFRAVTARPPAARVMRAADELPAV